MIVQGSLTESRIYNRIKHNNHNCSTSGSTKFGNTLDDTHQITNSLRVTGSGDPKVFEVKSRTGSVPVFQVDNVPYLS